MYRSAGAEFILRKKLAEAGVDDWSVDSAGTLQLNRTRRPEDFGRILAEKGYEFGGVTKYVYEADAASADAPSYSRVWNWLRDKLADWT